MMARANVLNVITIILVILVPHFAGLPFFSYTIVCAGLIALNLRLTGRHWPDIGVTRPTSIPLSFLIGTASALLWTAFNQLVYIPFIHHFFEVPEYTEYNFVQNNLSALLAIILAAWVVGGLYEEIVFRGFIQSSIFRGSKVLAVLITSCLFGLYHWQQGIFGVIPSMLGGMYWSYITLRARNLWPAIFSHAVYDTTALTMIYFEIFGVIRF